MSLELLFIVFFVVMGVVVFGLLAAGCSLLIRDTIRQNGPWGINLRPPTECPECGTPPPLVRIPKNRTQALWGGWTCTGCGREYDRWGEPVAEQPFPAKWSAKMDDAPAINVRIKRPSTDIERKGDSHE